MLLGEDHRGIEADHREAPGDVQDDLDDVLADLRVEEVQLRRVIPREARAVVAVVDVALVAGPAVEALEGHRRVAVVPVVVLQDDPHALVRGEVRTAVGIGGVRRLRHAQEPLGVVDDPA